MCGYIGFYGKEGPAQGKTDNAEVAVPLEGRSRPCIGFFGYGNSPRVIQRWHGGLVILLQNLHMPQVIIIPFVIFIDGNHPAGRCPVHNGQFPVIFIHKLPPAGHQHRSQKSDPGAVTARKRVDAHNLPGSAKEVLRYLFQAGTPGRIKRSPEILQCQAVTYHHQGICLRIAAQRKKSQYSRK
ncbi:hypothetical protein FQZ97_857300 [compost metagenome]